MASLRFLKAWRGFTGYTTYSQPLERDMRYLDEFLRDLRANLGKTIPGDPNSSNTTINLTAAAAGLGLYDTVNVDHEIVLNVGHADGTITVNDDDIQVNQAFDFTWTGQHNWNSDTNDVGATINKTSSQTTSHLFQILDTDAGEFVDVGNDGHTGFNCPSDTSAITAIQAVGGTGTGLLAWYKSDAIVAADVSGGLSAGNNILVWRDQSGNSNDLTAAGIKDNGGATSVRPRWFPAGASNSFSNLPQVNHFADSGTDFRYFTFATPLSLDFTVGYTIFFLVTDFTSVSQRQFILGDTSLTSNVLYGEGAGSSISQWGLQEGGTDKHYGPSYAHTDGNERQSIVLRCKAGALSGPLDMWYVRGESVVAPTHITGDSGNSVATKNFTNFGLAGSGGSFHGLFSWGFAEFGVINRDLSDAEAESVCVYLSQRAAGLSPSFPLSGASVPEDIDLTRWKGSDATVLSKIDEHGRFGFGVTNPSTPIHVINSSEQMRLGTSTTNYFSTTVGASGAVTFDSVPSSGTAAFKFSDRVDFDLAIRVGTASSFYTQFAVGSQGGNINYTLPVNANTGVLHNASSGTLSWSAVSLTADVSGILPIANGGTNSGTALSGSTIMISNGTQIVQGAAGTTTTVLHGNASGAPTYAAVSLTADVTGTLPTTNGGTGLSTWTQGDVPYFNTGTALSKLAKDANATRYLSNTGSSNNPAWAQVDLTNGVTGDLPYANFTPASAASRLLGRGSASGAGDWQEITLGSNLTMTGTVLDSTGGGGGGTPVVVTTQDFEVATILLDQTLSGSQSSFSVSSLSSAAYDYIQIELISRTDKSGSSFDHVLLSFNGDTTNSNYRNAYLSSGTTNPAAGGDADARLIGQSPGDTAPTDSFGAVTAKIFSPNSAKHKVAIGVSYDRESSTTNDNHIYSLQWENTSAIDSFTLTPDGGTNFVSGSRCIIKGYKSRTLVTNVTGSTTAFDMLARHRLCGGI